MVPPGKERWQRLSRVNPGRNSRRRVLAWTDSATLPRLWNRPVKRPARRRSDRERGWVLSSAARQRENRALLRRALLLMEPEAVLAFRCECERRFCRGVIPLTLAEYEAITAGRAVVSLGHVRAESREVVERTSEFCLVAEARVAPKDPVRTLAAGPSRS